MNEPIPDVLAPTDHALHLSDMGFEYMGQMLTKRIHLLRSRLRMNMVAVNVLLSAEGDMESVELVRSVHNHQTGDTDREKHTVTTVAALWKQLDRWQFAPVVPYCRADKIDTLLG